jgi:hypothetical protein
LNFRLHQDTQTGSVVQLLTSVLLPHQVAS